MVEPTPNDEHSSSETLSMNLTRILTAIAAPVLATVSFSNLAEAATFGPASNYNVFVFGDMNQSSDAEGRVAVGGNANFTNFGIGDRLENSNGADTRLVVGGDLNYQGGQIFGGSAVVGGQVKSNVNFNCGSNCKVSLGQPIDFGAAKTYLDGFSQQLGNLSNNGTTEYKWGGIHLQGGNSDLNVFTIDGSQFGNSSYLNLNGIQSGATVLFNILGDAVSIKNFGMNLNGINKENVLFNFVNATQVQTSGFSFAGSVLATNANFKFDNGNVEGRFIANSVTGSGEFHNVSFQGNVPVYTPSIPESHEPPVKPTEVPEPSLVLGLLVMLMAWRRNAAHHQQVA
jgi:choice-of-anchor A domain-containing protein